MRGDPIAYTYEADYHCPSCAELRFGRSVAGFIGEDQHDSGGNPVGVVSPWDNLAAEYALDLGDSAYTVRCGTCNAIVDEYEADR